MELAVIDTFVRSDQTRSGSRSSDESSSVSFSDVLNASTREKETRAPAARESAAPRADEPTAKPKADEPKAKPENSSSKPKGDTTKPAQDTAANAPAESPAADASAAEEAAPSPAPVVTEVAAPTDGTSAEALANLLAANSNVVDPATVQPQPGAPAVVAPAAQPAAPAVQPTNTTAAMPGMTAAPAETSNENTPAPSPATPSFDALAKAAAQAANSAANAAPAPATPAAAVAGAEQPAPVAPAVPATAPAAPAPVATSASQPAATAAMTVAGETLVAEMTDDLDAPVPTTPVTTGESAPSSTPSSNSGAARGAATQPTMSGYVAQMVSQEGAADDGAVAPVAPTLADGESAAFVPADADAAAMLDDAPDGLAPGVTKSADGVTFSTGDAEASHDANAVEAVAARHTRPVAVPVAEQVVVRIAKAISDGVDRINVKLSPAELGHIDVRMEIGPDGKFQAVFAADRPQTLELLQRDARELARALQDAGLRADTGSLSFNLRGQGQQGQADSGPTQGSLPRGLAMGDLPAEAAPPPVYRPTGQAAGRVDIRV